MITKKQRKQSRYVNALKTYKRAHAINPHKVSKSKYPEHHSQVVNVTFLFWDSRKHGTYYRRMSVE